MNSGCGGKVAELLAELAKGWGHGLGDAVGYAVVGGILAEKTVNCFFMIFTPPRSPGKKKKMIFTIFRSFPRWTATSYMEFGLHVATLHRTQLHKVSKHG